MTKWKILYLWNYRRNVWWCRKKWPI